MSSLFGSKPKVPTPPQEPKKVDLTQSEQYAARTMEYLRKRQRATLLNRGLSQPNVRRTTLGAA